MNATFRSRQTGAVLAVSLIVLLVMTLIGISAMRNTTLSERLAGNARNQMTAFQAAEAGLRGGEGWLLSQTSEPIALSDGSNNIFTLDVVDPYTPNAELWWCESSRNETWWSSNAEAFSGDLGDVSSPRYLMEQVEFVKDNLNLGQQQDATGKIYYRVTSRGTGGNTQAVALLQSTFARRY